MENQENKPEIQQKNAKQILGVGMMEIGIEFALIILAPLLVFIKLNSSFNKNHSPIFAIFGLLLALAISATAIGIRINKIRKQIK